MQVCTKGSEERRQRGGEEEGEHKRGETERGKERRKKREKTNFFLISRYLLEHDSIGIKDSFDNFGGTPLHHAAFNGNQQTLVYLLENGAPVNAKNKSHGMLLCLLLVLWL